MSSTSWDEIKRLAADFQRVQLVESNMKLSERNCIEIINKLMELGMINVIHSIDGKEFITLKQLEREIYDELYVHEGRINIVQLQTLLNVDVSHIEAKVNDIVKHDSNLVLILGQIISKDYMNKLAEEVNELLHDKESLELSELTSLYELPGEFVQQIIQPRMGTIINGNFDGKILYTHSYVNTQKSLLAGVLEASIKPIRFSQIVKDFNLDTGLIFELFDDLIANNLIKGSLFGGRQVTSTVFVPSIFTKAQQQYVMSFYKQNGYIEYSNLKKVGISEPDGYTKSLLGDQDIKYLTSCCLAGYFLDQIEQDVDDTLNRNGFCDISQLVPSALSSKDIISLTSHFETKFKATNDSVILAETYLVSKTFLKTLQSKFQAKMEEKSHEDLKKRNYVLAIRTEHAVAGGFSSGSSTNSNATTTAGKGSKSAKGKKAAAVVADTHDESMIEIVFIDKTSLINELKAMIKEINDDLLDAFVEHFLRLLNVQYFELLKTKVESGVIGVSPANEDAADALNKPAVAKKLTIKDLQEKIKSFLINARIFEKSMKLFTDAKVQDVISKHLIKTVGTEIVSEMLKLIADEQMIQVNDEHLNTDSRLKLIQKFKEPHKKGFTELNQAMGNKTFSEVIDLIEKVATDSLELSMKKADQKREKEMILQLRESTKASLESESDAATVLHLTCTLLFFHSTGQILNAPGRCVPNMLEFLREDILDETSNKLIYFQNLIIENVSKSKTDGSVASIDPELLKEIRSIGLDGKSFLKSTANKSKS